MAAQDLTTIDNAKAWLALSASNNSDDAALARLITAVSQDFMRATRRPDLLLASYTEAHLGDGGYRMVLFHWPIVAVTTLTIGGVTIPASANKIAAGYFFDSDIDPERIWQLYLNGSVFTDTVVVQVEYNAGYVQPGTDAETGQVPLPGDIEQAVLEWLAYRYKSRPNAGATMRRTPQGEETQVQQVDAPASVLDVIARYARVLPSIDRRGDEAAERARRFAPKK